MNMKRSPKKDIAQADELRSTWESVRDGFAQEGLEVDVSEGVDHAIRLRAEAAQASDEWHRKGREGRDERRDRSAGQRGPLVRREPT